MPDRPPRRASRSRSTSVSSSRDAKDETSSNRGAMASTATAPMVSRVATGNPAAMGRPVAMGSDPQRRPDSQQDSAREDQIREARARMAAEGEKPAPRPPRAQARSSRQQQWDPRRSEPREPAYAQPPQPDPNRTVTVIQKKRSFRGMVGALLGRKTEGEE
jgi:hypothetical protein